MEHFRQEKNEYFTHAVMLVTSDDSLGPTEISYLENAFHSRALAAGRVRTLNSNDPSPGTVTEEKQADLEEFIAFATIAIGSLGYRIFEKADDDKASAAAALAPHPMRSSLWALPPTANSSGKPNPVFRLASWSSKNWLSNGEPNRPGRHSRSAAPPVLYPRGVGRNPTSSV